MCHFNKCFLGSPISFLETSQFFIHLQPSYKSKKIMSFFSQKDYKMLHGLGFGHAVLFLVYLEKYFQGQFIAVTSCGFERFIPANFLQIACSFPAIPAASSFSSKKAARKVILSLFRAVPISEYLWVLQVQQCLCNVEVDQQRGGIHNGGDQG